MFNATKRVGDFLIPRLLQLFLMISLIAVLTFLLTQLLSGDQALRIAAGRYGYDYTTTELAELVRQELGLNRPKLVQFYDWFNQLLRFNLGDSMVTGMPVWQAIKHQLGHTLLLALGALGLGALMGVGVGLWASYQPNRCKTRTLLIFSASFKSLPHFAFGVILIVIFAEQLDWLPAAGYDGWQSAILPCLTLSFGLAAVSAQVTHKAAEQTLTSAYYRFARLKGLSDKQAFWQHSPRHIALPVLAYLGIQCIYLIEGVVVVETLFAWPGIGHALVHAIIERDIPMIQGTALCMGVFFILINTLVDVVCLALDPRLQEAK